MIARLPLPLLWLLCLLVPISVRAQEPVLSSLTDAAFSKWLTGTEWKGTLDGKGAHLWFATPGIVIVRWEFNPGVWDCRAAALVLGEKGKLKWRWNPDSVASCTCAVSEDLKSLALEDGLMGKWTLAVSARKPCAVTGGKLATMGAAGFSSWLEKQGLWWRDYKLDFGKGRAAGWKTQPPGHFEIVSPGVVEVYPSKEHSDGLLVVFTPSLESAMVYTNWAVTGARVKSAPETTIMPAPVFNDPAPSKKTLSAMSKEDFEKWLVGTEWELAQKDGPIYYWFPVPNFVTWRRAGEHYGMGASVSASGRAEWLHRVEKNNTSKLLVATGLSNAELQWANGKRSGELRLMSRRMPVAMNVASAGKIKELLPAVKVYQGENRYFTFPSEALALWNSPNSEPGQLSLTVPGPGIALLAWKNNPMDSALILFRTPDSGHIYTRGGRMDVAIKPIADGHPANSPTPDTAGGLFDMGLDDTTAIPVKNPAVSVNALVVMDLGGGRTAGALSKLSLTSLALTKDDAATIAFNQPVGADMKKALREVTRFHAIRQQGWPRGQKMELSFADKYSPKDGPSAAVACALLLESALRGVALQPDFAVTGDMNADGSVQPIGGVAGKLRGATKGGCKVAAIPEKNSVEATDLALTDGAAPFLGIQVFSISHFDDAVKLAVRDDATLRVLCESFAAIAAKIRAAPSTLRQAETIAGLRNLVRQAPAHLSARLLLAIAEDKLPAALSPPGSLNAIELAITDALEGTSQELLAKSNLDRGKVSAARGKLQQLRGKLDKRTHPLADAWVAWCQSVERITAASGKVNEQAVKEHNATVKRITAEEEKLRANADFREDLMR
jgi:hypothetical protein